MQIEGFNSNLSFPGGGASGKEPTWQCRRCRRHGFDLWVGKISWRREWPPTPVFLPGESHRGSWWATVRGVAELDTTEATEHAQSQTLYLSRLIHQQNIFKTIILCYQFITKMKRSLTFPSLDVPATCPVAIVTLSG